MKVQVMVSDKKYMVEEAKSEEELRNGLKGVKSLPDNEGMLFYIPEESQTQTFTMEGMLIPLDIIFINQDQEIVDVRKNCQPDEKDITNSIDKMAEDDYIAYVLEVNPDSGIKVGDYVDLNDTPPVMKVLAQDGSTQMDLWGGERIFSRKNTVILIKKAKKADQTKDDKDYKALGRYMFKCIKVQDERQPEYVESPK